MADQRRVANARTCNVCLREDVPVPVPAILAQTYNLYPWVNVCASCVDDAQHQQQIQQQQQQQQQIQQQQIQHMNEMNEIHQAFQQVLNGLTFVD